MKVQKEKNHLFSKDHLKPDLKGVFEDVNDVRVQYFIESVSKINIWRSNSNMNVARCVTPIPQRIGFIGGGKMAMALAKGFMADGLVSPSQV